MIDAALDVASWVALVAGSFFYVVGAIGLNRMPDVFTRMHAVSVSDTLGAGLLIVGMMLQTGDPLVLVRLVVILLVLAFTGSVATHALARAALHDGVRPLIASRDGTIAAADADRAAVALAELVPAPASQEVAPSNP